MKLLRNILILALAAGGGFFALNHWSAREAASEAARDADSTAPAQRRDIESSLLLTGEVVPAFQVEVKPEVGGKVRQIHVQPGEHVARGGLLVTIDDTDLLTEKATAQTEIAGAQLSVDKFRGNYERARKLHDEKLISKEVYDNLGADLAIAENNLEKARARMRTVEDKLSKTRILAPSDGTVLDVMVNEGQVVVAAASVNAGTVLMSFADLSRLLINSHANQMDALSLKVGLDVKVDTSGTDGRAVPARIEFIAPLATVRNNIKGFEVQATIEDAAEMLKPGMSVSMTVPIAKAAAAVSVPVSAVFREENKSVVYVRKGGAIERRQVEVGISNLGFAEIRAGIEEGEEILLSRPPYPHGKS